MNRQQRMALIAQEFGQPFDDVIADFAKDHSYTFTMLALGLNKETFAYLKPLFKPRLMQRQARPHVTAQNKALAKRYEGFTVTDIVKRTGFSRSTVHYRVSRGWSIERILATKPRHRGNVANFGSNRNTETWAKRITREYDLMKDKQK